ncbi:hypothetical protein E6H36_01705 [Candidatus Bathyarchaeota archaeon]|nr:MAG: hypothetical protein E6H36_01705 [Candidatus Bathyarchaeota archaeon]
MSVSKFQQSIRRLQKKSRLLAVSELGKLAKLDVGREVRKGVPEVILAEGKEPDDVARIVGKVVVHTGRAIVSRASQKHLRAVKLRSGSGEEARIIAEEMGCKTKSFNDVGVAGLHRLFEPLKDLLRWDADVILVVAGREGALPTVVAGIVDVPVVGVPTSRSYGFGDKGLAALAAMLQSCSLGMSVVNIDGGVGAGAVAAMIANRVGQVRASRSDTRES